MDKLIIILTTFLIIANSCFAQSDMDSKQIEKYFDKKERKELVKIISFVDSLIISKTELKEIDKAYHKYLDLLHENAANGDLHWAFDEEMKYNFLFNIDSTVFNKIWFKSTTSRIVKTRDTTLYNPENFISIDLNNISDFVQLIKKLGKNNKYYKDFYDSIEITGALSPTIVAGFLYNHNDFDFNDSNDRLWAAVFLLTLEESVEKKVKRYLNE
ncbi:hypothetical protein [uncultured Draconibacterium sp.]|uniref:hypothetical protein n=1 Tax=uncultured Draconibacterium sp. TaxID=1573823 RepID=UPI003260200A